MAQYRLPIQQRLPPRPSTRLSPSDIEAGGGMLPLGIPSIEALTGASRLPAVRGGPPARIAPGGAPPPAAPTTDAGRGLDLAGLFQILGLAGSTALGAAAGGGLGAITAAGAALQGLNAGKEQARQIEEQRQTNRAKILQAALNIQDPHARMMFVGSPIFRDFLGEEAAGQIEGLSRAELSQASQTEIARIRRRAGGDALTAGASPETVALRADVIGPIEPKEGEAVADYLKRTAPVESEYQVTAPLVQKHREKTGEKDRTARLKALQGAARSATTPQGKKAIADLLRAEGFADEADALEAEASGRQTKADVAAGKAKSAADLAEQRQMFARVDRLIRAGVPDEAASLLEAAGFPQDAAGLRTAAARKADKGESPFTREVLARSFQFWQRMQKTDPTFTLDQAITQTEKAVQKLQQMRGTDAGVEAAVKALQGQTPAQIERQLSGSRTLTKDQKDEVRRRLGVAQGDPLDFMKLLGIPDTSTAVRR